MKSRLPALQHPDFRRWILGSFLSNIGTQLQVWAMFWHLDHLTHRPISVGLVGLVRVVPLLVFGLFGGVVADQRDRRSVLYVTQFAMSVCAVILAFLTYNGLITPMTIYGLVAVDATARAYNGPARQAIFANLVPNHDFTNAASINGVQWRMSEVLGPATTGLIISLLGAHQGLTLCYSLNAVSFVALVWALRSLPAQVPATPRSKGAKEIFASIGEGITFLRTTPVISNATFIDFWGTFLAGVQALLPAFVRAELHLGPRWYGLLAAAGGLGAAGASAVVAMMPRIRRQGEWVIGMIALFGLSTILFGLSHNFWLAAFAYAAIGATDMVSTVMRQTIRQITIPDAMRGRLSAIGMILQISGPQLGDTEAAAVAEQSGVRASMLVGGMGALLIAGWYRWRGKALREFEYHP